MSDVKLKHSDCAKILNDLEDFWDIRKFHKVRDELLGLILVNRDSVDLIWLEGEDDE